MKIAILSATAASLLLLGACSTNKLAQQKDITDDVYYTEAKAKEALPVTARTTSYKTDEQLYGGNDYANDIYADSYYGSRINRFYYPNRMRSYYDNMYYNYQYDPFGYGFNSFYRPGLSFYMGLGSGLFYDPFMSPYMGYNSYAYGGGFWGPYSYYNTYPGYGYGTIGNVGGGYNNPNYRSRPDREISASGRGNIYSNPRTSSGSNGSGSTVGRPTRGATTQPSGRVSQQPAPRTQEPAARPERNTPAPSYNGGSNSGGGSSSGGGGSSSGGGSRPSR